MRRSAGRSAWPAAQFDTFDPVALAYDGCGSCYRAPPVGLAFYTAEDEILREKVCNGVLTAYGDYEGAFMVAKAVALLTQAASPAEFDPEHFLQQLKSSMEGVANEPLSLGYKVRARERRAGAGVCSMRLPGVRLRVSASAVLVQERRFCFCDMKPCAFCRTGRWKVVGSAL